MLKLPPKEELIFNNAYDFSEFLQKYSQANKINIFDLMLHLNSEFEMDMDDMIKLLTPTLVNIMKSEIKGNKLQEVF